MTRLHLPAAFDVADFLKDNQDVNGWWSVYPADLRPQNASTYATSMAILALSELVQAPDISEARRRDIHDEITSGVGWLRAKREKGSRPSWKDYPDSPDGQVRLSLSALVIHVLKKADPDDYDTSISEEWLDSLPQDIPDVWYEESAAHPIFLKAGGEEKDSVRYFVLQPVIIATADAFPDGSVTEKLRALDWLTRVIAKTPSWDPTIDNYPYMSAEFLISLRTLAGQQAF